MATIHASSPFTPYTLHPTPCFTGPPQPDPSANTQTPPCHRSAPGSPAQSHGCRSRSTGGLPSQNTHETVHSSPAGTGHRPSPSAHKAPPPEPHPHPPVHVHPSDHPHAAPSPPCHHP